MFKVLCFSQTFIKPIMANGFMQMSLIHFPRVIIYVLYFINQHLLVLFTLPNQVAIKLHFKCFQSGYKIFLWNLTPLSLKNALVIFMVNFSFFPLKMTVARNRQLLWRLHLPGIQSCLTCAFWLGTNSGHICSSSEVERNASQPFCSLHVLRQDWNLQPQFLHSYCCVLGWLFWFGDGFSGKKKREEYTKYTNSVIYMYYTYCL